MKALTYQAEFTDGTEVRLALLSYIEDNVYVIYSPALDLYGYGNDEGEARESFSVSLTEYINYTAAENTLSADLRRLGWGVNETSHTVTMPNWVELLQANPHLNDVVTNRPFKKFDHPARIPAFA